jgi:hypothetical protein
MYDAPLLERYGTLRELTAHSDDNAKRPSVNDIATVFGQGGNDGCNLHAQPSPPTHAGCPFSG